MHTETEAQYSPSSFPHLIHQLHANCPNCGKLIDIPVAAVHSDGSGRGYCSKCRTEVFEATLDS